MDAIDAFTTASESYGDWENVVLAVLALGLNVRLIIWALLGLPGRQQD